MPSRRVLVAGAGPAGLEYARVAAARGHDVVVLEREDEVGGHVRSFSRLPGRTPFYGIAAWLAKQAEGNGAEIRVSTELAPDGDVEGFDHVVVATGARYSADGFQGQTAGPLPGTETGRCVAWDAVEGVLYLTEVTATASNLHRVTPVELADASTWTIEAVGDGVPGFVDGALATARFRSPTGLFLDEATRTLYVADTGNHVVRAIDLATDTIDTVLGRPATLGYFDLSASSQGTQNFGGIRPGCWINAIPAGGILLVPDAASGCVCSYLNQAWFALESAR